MVLTFQVNPSITSQETKEFLARVSHPLSLPQSPDEENEKSASGAHVDKVIAEMLFRRQDMHTILDTMRLIDEITIPLKILEHRFILSSYHMGYRDHFHGEGDPSSDSESSDDSDYSDDSDIDEGRPRPTLVNTITNLFSAKYGKSNTQLDDYELVDQGRSRRKSSRRYRGEYPYEDDYDYEFGDESSLIEPNLIPRSMRARKSKPGPAHSMLSIKGTSAIISNICRSMISTQKRKEILLLLTLVFATLVLLVMMIVSLLNS